MKARVLAAGLSLVGAVAMMGAMSPSALAQRSTPVTVVNPESAPVPVTPTSVAGRPVQGSVVLVVPAGEFSDLEQLIVPPPGTMVVIEYLTIAVDSRNTEEQGAVGIRTALDGSAVVHRLGPLPPLVRTGLGSGFSQELQRNLTLYSDAAVDVFYQRGTGFDGERAIVQVTFAGRLVPIP
ncbi:MAG: hypothetical protein H6983_10210 [Ectothiorhodospiraceae bacterium]|nr:hypothetical protein [Chromatiales bacterium]MCP5154529.1 hypothetical protein [Ectothiorhodospiraceae bacterium]